MLANKIRIFMLTPFVWLALSLPALGKSQATVRVLTEFTQSLNLHGIVSLLKRWKKGS